MESILPLLIGLAFIILQALASGKKKEAARRQQTAQPQHTYPYPQQQPAKPAYDPFEELLRNLRPVEQQNTSTPEVQENAAKKEGGDVYVSPYRPLMTEILPPEEQNVYGQIAENASIETETPAEWNTGDFDMRKAIIYSEILRPKYAS